MTRRRPRPSEIATLALASAGLALPGCGGSGENENENEVTAVGNQPVAEEAALDPADGSGEPAELGPVPSDFARRSIPRRLLRLYVQSGDDLLLDWWVIAAVDQIDLKAGNPTIPPRERIPGIGYSLAAAGAPHDYHAALAARAGGAYADRALKLAGRYVDTQAEQRENERENENGDPDSDGETSSDQGG